MEQIFVSAWVMICFFFLNFVGPDFLPNGVKITLPETNMASENRPLDFKVKFLLETIHFSQLLRSKRACSRSALSAEARPFKETFWASFLKKQVF